MTRHGTLAYYLAAWIVGCSVAALVCWGILAVQDRHADFPLLFAALFFALIGGAGDTLLFGFILRRLMHLIRARNVTIWSFAGAALCLGLDSLLALAAFKLPLRVHSGAAAEFAGTLVFGGPAMVWMLGWWQTPIEGAILGAVLALIDRAFNPASSADAPEPSSGHAAAPTS